MQRSLLASLVVSVMAAAVLFTGGCGGGGGGSSSGGTDSGGSTSGTPTGTVFSQLLVGTTPSGSVARSLDDLAVGETVNLRSLNLYTSAGTAYGNVANIVLSASPTVVTLDGSSLHAVGEGTATITATNSDGTPLHDGSGGSIGSVTIVVGPEGAKITGRSRGPITTTAAAAGIGSVTISFFDSTGTIVGQTLSSPDGRYQANIPANAVSFIADFSRMPNTYFNQFTYGSLDYSASIDGCAAPLPGISTGGATALSDLIPQKKNSDSTPPPPPSGCGD